MTQGRDSIKGRSFLAQNLEAGFWGKLKPGQIGRPFQGFLWIFGMA
jgi:hypothetical protein